MYHSHRLLALVLLLLVTAGGLFLSPNPAYALDPGAVFTQTDMRQTCANLYNTSLRDVGTAVPNFSSPFSSTRIVVWTCGNIQVFKEHGVEYCKSKGYKGFNEITKEMTRFFFFKYTVRIGFRCTR